MYKKNYDDQSGSVPFVSSKQDLCMHGWKRDMTQMPQRKQHASSSRSKHITATFLKECNRISITMRGLNSNLATSDHQIPKQHAVHITANAQLPLSNQSRILLVGRITKSVSDFEEM